MTLLCGSPSCLKLWFSNFSLSQDHLGSLINMHSSVFHSIRSDSVVRDGAQKSLFLQVHRSSGCKQYLDHTWRHVGHREKLQALKHCTQVPLLRLISNHIKPLYLPNEWKVRMTRLVFVFWRGCLSSYLKPMSVFWMLTFPRMGHIIFFFFFSFLVQVHNVNNPIALHSSRLFCVTENYISQAPLPSGFLKVWPARNTGGKGRMGISLPFLWLHPPVMAALPPVMCLLWFQLLPGSSHHASPASGLQDASASHCSPSCSAGMHSRHQ